MGVTHSHAGSAWALSFSTIQDLLANADAHNKRLIIRARPSSDPVLDDEAWSKTTAEIAMHIVAQPVCDPTDIPLFGASPWSVENSRKIHDNHL